MTGTFKTPEGYTLDFAGRVSVICQVCGSIVAVNGTDNHSAWHTVIDQWFGAWLQQQKGT